MSNRIYFSLTTASSRITRIPKYAVLTDDDRISADAVARAVGRANKMEAISVKQENSNSTSSCYFIQFGTRRRGETRSWNPTGQAWITIQHGEVYE